MFAALAKDGWPDGNLIISAVPPEERDYLLPRLESIDLRGRQALYVAGAHLDRLYFPLDSVVATLGVSRKGATAQYALVGNESFIGLNALLGDSRAVGSAIVQSPGRCYRVGVQPMAKAFQRSEALRRVVLRCVSSRMTQTSQTSLCNALHPVEQRLCCWLLQTLDRLPSRDLTVTQELVALVLGVRREAVTIAALRLQARGAIRCGRGHILVLERRVLEERCCECYALLRDDVAAMARDISGVLTGSHAR